MGNFNFRSMYKNHKEKILFENLLKNFIILLLGDKMKKNKMQIDGNKKMNSIKLKSKKTKSKNPNQIKLIKEMKLHKMIEHYIISKKLGIKITISDCIIKLAKKDDAYDEVVNISKSTFQRKKVYYVKNGKMKVHGNTDKIPHNKFTNIDEKFLRVQVFNLIEKIDEFHGVKIPRSLPVLFYFIKQQHLRIFIRMNHFSCI